MTASSIILKEPISTAMAVFAVAVVTTVAIGRRMPIRRLTSHNNSAAPDPVNVSASQQSSVPK